MERNPEARPKTGQAEPTGKRITLGSGGIPIRKGAGRPGFPGDGLWPGSEAFRWESDSTRRAKGPESSGVRSDQAAEGGSM